MITTLVQFKLPRPVTVEEASAIFEKSAPLYRDMPGLIRKYYVLTEDGSTAGGVYLWETREAAERAYAGEWRASVKERYGAEPAITYFNSPVVVDNLAGSIISQS